MCGGVRGLCVCVVVFVVCVCVCLCVRVCVVVVVVCVCVVDSCPNFGDCGCVGGWSVYMFF